LDSDILGSGRYPSTVAMQFDLMEPAELLLGGSTGDWFEGYPDVLVVRGE